MVGGAVKFGDGVGELVEEVRGLGGGVGAKDGAAAGGHAAGVVLRLCLVRIGSKRVMVRKMIEHDLKRDCADESVGA